MSEIGREGGQSRGARSPEQSDQIAPGETQRGDTNKGDSQKGETRKSDSQHML